MYYKCIILLSYLLRKFFTPLTSIHSEPENESIAFYL